MGSNQQRRTTRGAIFSHLWKGVGIQRQSLKWGCVNSSSFLRGGYRGLWLKEMTGGMDWEPHLAVHVSILDKSKVPKGADCKRVERSINKTWNRGMTLAGMHWADAIGAREGIFFLHFVASGCQYSGGVGETLPT